MISDKMAQEINEQLMFELSSGHLYLAMAAYCSSIDLEGFANYFVIQEQEERFHAMKFYNYLTEQSKKVELTGIEQPETNYSSVKQVFEMALAHEQIVTKRINNIMELAVEEKDFATQALLQWFISEQVEEEANMQTILGELSIVGEKGHGLLMLDREKAQRTFVEPA